MRVVLAFLLAVGLLLPMAPADAATASVAVTPAVAAVAVQSPVALVYRGPAACDGCPEAAARLLRNSPQHFATRYVGPKEGLKLEPASFAGVSLYVQPGGDTTVRKADRLLGRAAQDTIRMFISNGGHYLGICQGAYLAGTDPGMGLLSPGNSWQYIKSKGASTRSAKDTLVPIRWGRIKTMMFFQDGPYLTASGVVGERVLARYTNRRIAALVRPFGLGRVAVVGPHPEATPYWYRAAHLPNRAARGAVLGHKLIRVLMAPNP
ncbi:MAG: BPL-N domain-containing protein [Actinomycetes bacterium]